MRGAGLKRYHPDQQKGAGFVQDVVGDAAIGFGQAVKSSKGNAMATLRRGAAGGKRAAKRAVKRKGRQYASETTKRARKALKDIFGA